MGYGWSVQPIGVTEANRPRCLAVTTSFNTLYHLLQYWVVTGGAKAGVSVLVTRQHPRAVAGWMEAPGAQSAPGAGQLR